MQLAEKSTIDLHWNLVSFKLNEFLSDLSECAILETFKQFQALLELEPNCIINSAENRPCYFQLLATEVFMDVFQNPSKEQLISLNHLNLLGNTKEKISEALKITASTYGIILKTE